MEGNICQENGPLPDCFSKPRDIVLHTLEKVTAWISSVSNDAFPNVLPVCIKGHFLMHCLCVYWCISNVSVGAFQVCLCVSPVFLLADK